MSSNDNVKKVEELIKKHKLDAKVIKHPEKAVRTLQDHLDLHKDTPDQVLKVMCMVSGKKPLVVLASGEVEIDMKKLSEKSGLKDIRMANKDELKELFRREPGGVDALTIPKSVPMFGDKILFEKSRVTGSAGSPYAGLKIKPKEILKVRKLVVGNFGVKLSKDIQKRLKLIKEVGEQITTEEDLKDLLKEKKKFIAYDGFEPSGSIHVAQGILRAININKMTKAGAHFKMWVADWHAWANNKMGGDLDKIQVVGNYFIEVWKAAGLDLNNVEFVWASDAVSDPEYWKIVMNIAINSTIKRIVRCGTILGRKESEMRQASQIFAPVMQAADIFYLNVDICSLGVDQLKVNILARELGPKLGFWKPVVVSHKMLMGLTQPVSKELDPEKRTIELKMSKSKPDTAVFMTDSEKDIYRKIQNAWCPDKQVEENPILEWCKCIVFEKYDEFDIKRADKFGGDVRYNSYKELEDAYVKGDIHPLDLKKATSYYINEMIKPVREHFEKDPKAKKLKKQVESFKVTR